MPAGPHEEFVAGVHRCIARFTEAEGVPQAFVQVELADGSRFTLHSISPDPGFGFVTIRPHPEDRLESPGELIVPVGSIRRIELDRAEAQRARLGFSLPEA